MCCQGSLRVAGTPTGGCGTSVDDVVRRPVGGSRLEAAELVVSAVLPSRGKAVVNWGVGWCVRALSGGELTVVRSPLGKSGHGSALAIVKSTAARSLRRQTTRLGLKGSVAQSAANC